MSDAASPVTREGLDACRLRPSTQLLLPGGGFRRAFQCVEHPRLERHQYRAHGKAPVLTSYHVDGVRCTSLDDAIAALNGPVLSDLAFEKAAS